MKRIEVSINGISPLLMKSARGLDPTDSLKRESSEIARKGARKRTDSDEERLLELDFLLALYHDGKQPVIPESCVIGTIHGGAKRSRQGKEILAAVMIEPEEIPLIYKGPKDPETLLHSKTHRDVRPVVMKGGGGRILRCRPRFNEWGLDFSILYDEKTISERTLRKAMDDAGQYVGLCDFRPRFGRFEVTRWDS